MRGQIAGTEIGIELYKEPSGELQVTTECGRDKAQLQAEFRRVLNSPLLFVVDINPPKREMSRFLCKVALECVAETFSVVPGAIETIVENSFFDNVRDYARLGENFADWPYSMRRVFPEETLMQHPDSNEWVQAGFGCTCFMNKRRETLFAFLFYGVEFVINVGGPSILGYQEWLEEHGSISPMVERVGCRLVVDGEGDTRSYRLYGSFNARAGLDFDKAHGYLP